MKKSFLRITGMLALAFLAATQTVRAQQPLIANVPFEFTAGDKMLPAGEYRVQKSSDGSPALLIQRTDGSAVTYVQSSGVELNPNQQAQSKLVFHRYGDRYFLSQVWRADTLRGRELPKSVQEKEQALAARHQKPDLATIAASITPPKP
jgi:hypothetical protein